MCLCVIYNKTMWQFLIFSWVLTHLTNALLNNSQSDKTCDLTNLVTGLKVSLTHIAETSQCQGNVNARALELQ